MDRKPQRPKRRRARASGGPSRAPCPDSPDKTPYRSPKAAEIAILKAQDLATLGEDVPQRAYECPGCALWHLSKHPDWQDRD